MKAIIIDDERLAREELRGLLTEHSDIEICGEAANVTEALALLEKITPDLLFLDIAMPGRTGFDLLEALPPPHPRVIFTTAHDTFAVKAFEVNALDYLLKPVHPRRLAAALERIRTPLPVEEAANRDASAGPLLQIEGSVFVKDGDRCWFVALRSLRLLEADGNYTRLYFDKEKPIIYRTLGLMETRLPTGVFLRANRSQIINLNWIQSVEPWFSGCLRVRLRGGDEVEFSRRQSQLFRSQLGL